MEESAGGASEAQAVGTVGKVAGVEFVAAQIFDVGEGVEFGAEVGRCEEEPERLPGEGDAAGEGVMRQLLGGAENMARLAVVEDDA